MAGKPRFLVRATGRVAFAAIVLGLLGCSLEADPPQTQTRWARRVVPFEKNWRLESEIPSRPQKSPQMVLWESTAFKPGTPPTALQRKRARDFVKDCYRAALEHGWYEFKTGLSDGYQLMFNDRRHYENREFILDARVLDPDHPEFLMYYGTPKGKRLSGFMFYVDKPGKHGPQPGGNLTLWHYHIWTRTMCLQKGLISLGLANANANGVCNLGTPTHRSPEMLHVWLVDHPGGAYTTSMMIEPRLFKSLVAKRNSERPQTRVASDR